MTRALRIGRLLRCIDDLRVSCQQYPGVNTDLRGRRQCANQGGNLRGRGAVFYFTALAMVIAVALLWLTFEQKAPRNAAVSTKVLPDLASEGEALVPLPLNLPLDEHKVALGRELFNDARLSSDGTVSCASCHQMKLAGTDGRAVSVGVGGREGSANAPSVFNSGFNFRQFWDGRAASLEDQIDGPLQHPAEMAGNWRRTVDILRTNGNYRQQFNAIYAGAITEASVKDAIATFERSLITPNSRFDRYLRGEASALSSQERAGLQLFKDIGCISCHQGVNLGGNMYQKLGVFEDYYSVSKSSRAADQGRYNFTHHESDRHFFKVPGLRNVALTAPYLHDGSVPGLAEVVTIMARYQLGRVVNPAEVAQLVAFLGSLTGEYQGQAFP